jgi:regulator of replication initiation timing
MSKKNIRMLATGFLFSAVLLLVLQFAGQGQSVSSSSEDVEELKNEVRYLEEVATSLELENERLVAELEELSSSSHDQTEGAEDLENEEVDTEESEAVEEDAESDQTDEDADLEEEAEEEPAVTEYTVVIREGEPSSVIASQLQAHGLIEDVHAFNKHLEDNNLFRRIRPGQYTVRSDMNRDQLVEAVIR